MPGHRSRALRTPAQRRSCGARRATPIGTSACRVFVARAAAFWSGRLRWSDDDHDPSPWGTGEPITGTPSSSDDQSAEASGPALRLIQRLIREPVGWQVEWSPRFPMTSSLGGVCTCSRGLLGVVRSGGRVVAGLVADRGVGDVGGPMGHGAADQQPFCRGPGPPAERLGAGWGTTARQQFDHSWLGYGRVASGGPAAEAGHSGNR